MIVLRDVHKTFNFGTPLSNPVLRGLSLSLKAGEFVTVIGSNGAGKSTLLNAIAGEVAIERGQILIDGNDVTHLPAHRRTALIARVFQDPLAGTCANLTIAENLALAMKRGISRGLSTAVKNRYLPHFRDSLAEIHLGLENRLNDRMGLLSGGQRQAVSLIMSCLQPSKIILLDEHTAALDPKTAAFILQLTQNVIQRNQLTALMVTHSMKQALEAGSRTIMLHQGKVVFDIHGT
ncbi:MAG: ATP-binding cassette domain-containing protein, partial [Cardiobacteriaceae bacterium]|nr:ATP-binding cassette domain-containing protein [Cardiobacteriaceae bacterium]